MLTPIIDLEKMRTLKKMIKHDLERIENEKKIDAVFFKGEIQLLVQSGANMVAYIHASEDTWEKAASKFGKKLFDDPEEMEKMRLKTFDLLADVENEILVAAEFGDTEDLSERTNFLLDFITGEEEIYRKWKSANDTLASHSGKRPEEADPNIIPFDPADPG